MTELSVFFEKSGFSQTRRVLVTGATGQVGRALAILYGKCALTLPRDQFDLSVPESLVGILNHYNPAAVINPAAYTQVDWAEKEASLAYQINAAAPGVMARWCASRDVPFVHFSTDYVFNGAGSHSFTETDAVSPINVYGKSKLEGEKEIIAAGGRYLIFRTSWVYDAMGKNFFRTMLRLGAERDALRVVSDQFGAPTYADNLAAAVATALEKALSMPSFPSGIYHLCNSGVTNWHEFAEAIFAAARQHELPLAVQRVEPVASGEYPTAAKRPANSRLDTDKAEKTFGLVMPHWQDGLKQCMNMFVTNQSI